MTARHRISDWNVFVIGIWDFDIVWNLSIVIWDFYAVTRKSKPFYLNQLAATLTFPRLRPVRTWRWKVWIVWSALVGVGRLSRFAGSPVGCDDYFQIIWHLIWYFLLDRSIGFQGFGCSAEGGSAQLLVRKVYPPQEGDQFDWKRNFSGT
jgi:hypothetical protein